MNENRSILRYRVERYVPGATPDGLRAELARVAAAAAELAAEGRTVRYLGSTSAPDEESCFSTFESEGTSLVERVCQRADLGEARIALIEHWPPKSDRPSSAASERGVS